MPRLARLRVVGLGHAQARFEDVLMDFRDRAEAATDSTLWLRNGGGKSSLLSLFYAILVPGKREFLGRKADASRRELGEYVRPNECGVIAAEWELDERPVDRLLLGSNNRRNLITGVFYEGPRSSPPKLGRLFFMFEVSGGEGHSLQLETLPIFGSNGRDRRTMGGFRAALANLREEFPAAQVTFTEEQHTWTDYLEDAGLDPQLFSYQIQMNQREGGADECFRFSDSEEFIDFLLDLAFDTEFADEVSRTIGQFRKQLVDRKDRWLPERDLVRGLLDRLQPVLEVVAERLRLVELLSHSEALRQGLIDRLAAGRNGLITEIRFCEQAVSEGEKAIAASRESSTRFQLQALQFRYQAARVRASLVEGDLERSTRAEAEARREKEKWEAAEPMFRALSREQLARELQANLEQRRREFLPILKRLEAAATAYVAALKARIDRRNADVHEMTRTRSDALELQRHELQLEGQCRSDSAAAKERANGIRQRISRADSVRHQLEAAGVLRSGEPSNKGMKRLELELATGEARRSEIACELKELESRRNTLDRQRQATVNRANEARAQAGQISKAIEAADSQEREIVAHPHLRRILDSDTIELDRLGQGELALIRNAARDAQERILRLRATFAISERALTHLRQEGLLPPEPDVERLLQVLRAKLPRAWAGWKYMAENVPPGDWRKVIEQVPELVVGVVVRDDDFARAVEILSEAKFVAEGPVVLAGQAAFQVTAEVAASRLSSRVVLGPRSAAYYDSRDAELERDLLEHQQTESRAAIECEERDRQAIESLLHALEDFRRRYPPDWRADQERILEHVREDESEANREHQGLSVDLQASVDRTKELEAERERLAGILQKAEGNLAALQSYVREHEEDRAALEIDLGSIEGLRIAADQAAGIHAEAAAQAAQAAENLLEAIASTRENLQTDRDSLGRISRVEPRDIAPREGDADALADRYHLLEEEYAGKIGEEGIEARRKMAASDAATARNQARARLKDGLTETEVELAAASASDEADLERRREEADKTWQSTFGVKGNVTQRCREARRKLDEESRRITESGLQGDDLPPEVVELAPDEADREAERCEAERDRATQVAEAAVVQVTVNKDRQQELERELESKMPLLERAGKLAEHYEDLLARLGGPVATNKEVQDDARTVLGRLERDFKAARTAFEGIDHRRSAAARDLRAWATDRRFEDLRSELARRFQGFEDQDLEDRAPALLEALEARCTNLDQQIAEVDEHRSLLVGQIDQVAQRAFRLLQGAESQSRLPDHLPGLGGAQFLRIAAEPPSDPSERRGRLATLIDETVEAGTALGGLELAKRAVRKLARPIRVKVLNPDPQLGRVPVDIAAMAKFSGGERLTAAILLYCTLAQLRARNRARQRQSSGVLLLDNPIGTASRVVFLDLQRDVARAMGIQLIYATGVNDHEALRVLPNVIRLRNERIDRNTGNRLVEAEIPSAGGRAIGRIEAVHIGRDEEPAQGSHGDFPAGVSREPGRQGNGEVLAEDQARDS